MCKVTTATQARQQQPQGPSRTLRLKCKPVGRLPGVVSLTVNGDTQDYLISRVGSQFGDGYKLDKISDGSTYYVHLSDEGSTCECMGFCRHGHCKHIDSVRRLRDLDMID